MMVLFSFSWFSFCSTPILRAIQKIFALNNRLCSQLLSQISKIKVASYTAKPKDKEQKEPLIGSLRVSGGVGPLFDAVKSVGSFVKVNPVLNLKVRGSLKAKSED